MKNRTDTPFTLRTRFGLLAFLTVALATLLSACGGGGGGGGVPAERPGTHISGVGFDGPIQNGEVKIYDFADGARGELLETVRTDIDGLFEVNLNVSSRPLWVEVSGGRYKEEASGAVVDLQPGQMLRAVANYTSGQHFGLSVTAFSNMAAGLAQFLITSGVGVSDAISQANNRISVMLGAGVDVTGTQPLDVTDVRNQDAALSPGLQYGFITASISSFIDWVNKQGGQQFSSIGFAQLAFDDIRYDGRLDGQREAGPIALNNVPISAATYRNVIAENILAMAASANNVTAVAPRDLIETAIAYTSAPDGDQLFGDTPSLPFADITPTISNILPTADSVVAGTITAGATVTDLVGLESVRFLMDSAQVAAASGDLQNASVTIDTTAFEDGIHTLTIVAKNLVGNEAGVDIPISISNMGTSIANIAPGTGSFVRGAFTMSAAVADPAGIASVVFLAKGTGAPDQRLTAANPSSPSVQINSVPFDDGPLGVTITATNTVGNSKAVDVNYTVDNTNPTVTFNLLDANDAPVANNAVISGTLTITGSATDPSGIQRAELLVDGQSAQTFADPASIDTQYNTSLKDDGPRALAVVATDKAGNTANVARNVVVDNGDPAISIINPANGDTVSGTLDLVATATDTATDIASLKIVFDGVERQNQSTLPNVTTSIDLSGLSGSKTLSIEAVDEAGHRAVSTLNVVVDNDAPSVTLSGITEGQVVKGALNITASASDPSGIISATFTLNNQIIQQFPAGSDFTNMAVTINTTTAADGPATLRLLVQDAQGSSNTLTRRFTIDNTNPALTVSSPTANQTFDGLIPIKGSVSDATAVTLQLALAGATETIPLSGGSFDFAKATAGIADGKQTLTFTARDEASNTTTRRIDVFIDNTDPVISQVNVQTGQHVHGTFQVTARATDAGGNNLASVAFFFSGVSVGTATSGFNNLAVDIDTSSLSDGIHPLRIVATDQAGNEGRFEANLVVDNTAPVFGALDDITANATAANGAVVNFTVTATDALAPNVSVACTPVSGTRFPIGTTPVSCTATDQAGNSASGGFDVMVADTGAPTMDAGSVPNPGPFEATSADGAVVTYTLPTATDNTDPSPTVSCAPPAGSTLNIGTHTVSCTARDSADNVSGAVTFDVVVRDTTGPVFSNVPSDITQTTNDPAGSVVNYTKPTATDLVDGTVNVTCSKEPGDTFPVGPTTVSCSAQDSRGNVAAPVSFKVTISYTDNANPIISAASVPSLNPFEATSANGAVVTYTLPTATDNTDPNPTVSCTPPSGSTLGIGTHTVSCTARDSADNVSDPVTFDVIVRDTTGPTISNVPGDITESTTDPTGTIVSYTKPTATDLVDGAVNVTCSMEPGDKFPVGPTTVSCSAQDSRGNAATSVSFTVTVTLTDAVAPVISQVNVSDGQFVHGTFEVTARATDTGGSNLASAVFFSPGLA